MTTYTLPRAVRGKTYHAELDLVATSGTFTDCTLRMMVKRRSSDADAAALISLDNDLLGGLTVTGGDLLEIDITDTQMSAVPASAIDKRLFVGISIETPDGETHPLSDLDSGFFVDSHAVLAYAT